MSYKTVYNSRGALLIHRSNCNSSGQHYKTSSKQKLQLSLLLGWQETCQPMLYLGLFAGTVWNSGRSWSMPLWWGVQRLNTEMFSAHMGESSCRPLQVLWVFWESTLKLVAQLRSQCSERGISLINWVGHVILQYMGSSQRVRSRVPSIHMAKKPTATVVTMKLRARIHRTRGVLSSRSVCLIFAFPSSFMGAEAKNQEKLNW